MRYQIKNNLKAIILGLVIILILSVVYFQGFYMKVYNQSNIPENTAIGSNVNDLSTEEIIDYLTETLDNRYAGTKENAQAIQFIHNYFQTVGLKPYFESGYYQTFQAPYLKDTRFKIPVQGEVENVIGKIKGKDNSKAIVISAHMDSVGSKDIFKYSNSKGVLDNASGTAVLLKIAKKLSQTFSTGEYPVDLIFAAYNAEETGLTGSEAFYKELSEDYVNIYNINMDCVGAKNKPLAIGNDHKISKELYRDFIPYLKKHEIPYKDILYTTNDEGEVTGTSDHEIFQQNGKAAIILGEDLIYDIPHSDKDSDRNLLDYDEMDRLTNAIVDFIVSSNGKIY